MFGLFKSKPIYDDFYSANNVAPDKEHLLSIGALLIETNQFRDSLTLKSRWQAKDLSALLKNAWDIHNKESTIELLEELLLLPSKEDNDDIIDYVLVNKQPVEDTVINELLIDGYLFDSISRTCGKTFAEKGLAFTATDFDGLTNIASWDIERAGLVARYAYNSGWLNEDYYLSYLKGRALLYDRAAGDSFDYILYLKDMYLKDGFFCTKYPLR